MTEEREIALTVNILYGDKVPISISEKATVDQLMDCISAKTGIDAQQQRLIYLGRQLKREKLLSDYAIHDGVCIQLVRREAATSPPPVEGSSGEQHVLRESYVVYFPIRVTETTILPAAGNEETILEGAPPVGHYPTSAQRTDPPSSSDILLRRLTLATNQMAEESHQMEGEGDAEVDESSLHSLIHSYERVVDSLSDVYHSRREGAIPSEEKTAIRNAIEVIGDLSRKLSARLAKSS